MGDACFRPVGKGIHLERIQNLEQHHTADAAAGGHQAQGIQVGTVDERPRTEGEQFEGSIRFGRDHVCDPQGGVSHRQPVPDLHSGSIQQGLLHDACAGLQHLPEGSSRRQADPPVKGVTRVDHFQPGEHRGGFIRRTHHAVEFVNVGPDDPALIHQPVDGLDQARGDGVVGADDDVGGMQGAGIVQQGAAHAPGKPGKSGQGRQGKGHTEHEQAGLGG
jgi:hypothetical protein